MRTVATIAVVLLLIGGAAGLLLRNRLFGAGTDDPTIAGVVGTPTAVAAPSPDATAPPGPTATRAGSGRSVLDTNPTPPATRPASTAPAGETEPTKPDDSTQPTPPPDEGETELAGERDLADMLPTADEVPPGLVPDQPFDRPRNDVVENLGGGQAVEDFLSDRGWQGNAVVEFNPPPGVEPPSESTTFLSVSVHRFRDPEAASEALVFFLNAFLESGPYEEFDVEPIGDEIRLFKGSPQGALQTVVYVRDGDVLVRIGGSSPDGDPTEDVLAVARTVVSK
jgi:hypothetical protein